MLRLSTIKLLNSVTAVNLYVGTNIVFFSCHFKFIFNKFIVPIFLYLIDDQIIKHCNCTFIFDNKIYIFFLYLLHKQKL